MLRGGDVNEIQELKRQGLSVSQISVVAKISRPTVRKYLAATGTDRIPVYGPRKPRNTKLIPFTAYVDERTKAGMWNGVVLYRELKEQGYQGGYTAIKDYLQPKRKEARAIAVRRFETPPGRQAQVDWGEIGDNTLEDGTRQKLYCFVMTLGCSRGMFADIATDCKLPTFLRMHEAAFSFLGGVPEEVLYDNCKTVVTDFDGRGEPHYQTTFLDFARYWGFAPRLCRPYRPQTKGKIENGIGYVRKNFLTSMLGTSNVSNGSVPDLKVALQRWLCEVANVRIHGTTHQKVNDAWEREKSSLTPVGARPPYPLLDAREVLRRVARDAYVSFEGSRYSVPWQAAGKEVVVRREGGSLCILRDAQLLATHTLCAQRHQISTDEKHHEGIPLGAGGSDRAGKVRLSLKAGAPVVETRSLQEYEGLAGGAL
jgi:transposase